jgi:hypothetical protein
MKKIFRWLSSNDSIYNAALSFVAYRIEHHGELLTPDHLSSMGWIKEGNCWVEKNIKKRDKIWIQFEDSYYRVYHGADKTFMALKSNKVWFENYHIIMTDNRLGF